MKKDTKSSLFNRILSITSLVIVVIGLGSLVKYMIYIKNYTTTNDAQVQQYVTPVASRVTGFIKEVRFEENQFVHKGDTLVIIDNQEFSNNLNQADAALQASRASVSVNNSAVAATASTANIVKARLEAANVEVWKTEQNYKRYQNLLAQKAATQQQYEQMKAAHEVAMANYNAIKQEANTISLNTHQVASNVAPIQSNIKQKQATVSNASLYLSYTIVLAPYDGFVGKKNIQPGQLVKEGVTLVNVVSKEKWVSANFRETQIADIEEGATVMMEADAYPGKEFVGRVQSFSPGSGAVFSLIPQDNATGNFIKIEQRIPTKIIFSDTLGTDKLRAGMNVIVKVKIIK